MSFVMLLSSTGVGVYGHVCKFSGQKKTSLFEFKKSCCSVPTDNNISNRSIKKATCCKLEKQHLKINANSDVFSSLKSCTISNKLIYFYNTFQFVFTEIGAKSTSLLYCFFSPPFPQFSILLKNCVFRI